MIKYLICGSRDYHCGEVIEAFIDVHVTTDDLIIEGGATGADTLAAIIADTKGIHVAEIRPLWSSLGKRAGHVRNAMMLSLLNPEIDVVAAFYTDGENKSNGTAGCVAAARSLGILQIAEYDMEGNFL